MSPPLPLGQALTLGVLHGPTELLPVSSAGHTTLVPWLAGWPYAALDGELRKSFEVALHAGTAAALLLRPPTETPVGRLRFTLAGVLPPAAAGYALGEKIERRLGTPKTIAAGLLAGALAIALGEIGARRGAGRLAGRPRIEGRRAAEATAADGLAVGLAQALALGPGVSRSGTAFAAARLRGFAPLDADRLSWQAGLPVIAGATLLQAGRLRRRGAPPGTRAAMAMGTTGAFCSTLASVRTLGPKRRVAAMGLACVYRVALACLVFRRARSVTPPRESSGKAWQRT